METKERSAITIQTSVKAPIEKAWKYWSEPDHITRWATASDDWHAPYADNDLRTDGKFKTTMAAKDGSFSFDFEGTYTKVEPHKVIEYIMSDGRRAKVVFTADEMETKIMETFDPEAENHVDMQRDGWQAILNNFKRYTEAN
jgi:uncharacterized protein YndB with AHSA1/START domain